VKIKDVGFGQTAQKTKAKKARLHKFGKPGNRNRETTKIENEDVPKVAEMYFKDLLTVEEIAEVIGVVEKDVQKLITGRSLSSVWASAVVNLITTGVECTRSAIKEAQAKANLTRRHIAKKEDVVAIRQASMDGKGLKEICEEFGRGEGSVRKILTNESFMDLEYFPEGWWSRSRRSYK